MKRSLCLILALFLLFTQAVFALATDGITSAEPSNLLDSGDPTPPQMLSPPSPSLQEGLTELDGIFPPDDTVPQLPILSVEDDIAKLLPETVYGRYSGGLVECSVVWDISELTAPGRYTVPGTADAPPGYFFKADGNSEKTTLTVVLYGDEPEVILDIIDRGDIPYHPTVVLAQNSDAVSALPYDTVELVSSDKDHMTIPVEWDLSALDTTETGRYTVYATPLMPPGTRLANPGTRVPQDLYVMKESAVDLGGYYVDATFIFCHWLTAIDPEQAILEFSTDGNRWLPIKELLTDDGFLITEQYLQLDTGFLEIGAGYYFRLLYQGKSDGVLHLTISETNVPIPDWEGDRDGGDAEDDTVFPPSGQLPPPMPPNTIKPPDTIKPPSALNPPKQDSASSAAPPDTQNPPQTLSPPSDQDDRLPLAVPPTEHKPTAPAAPSQSTAPPAEDSVPAIAPPKASQEPTVPNELVTHDTLTISGARLAWMLREGGNTIPFGRNGISLEIPADFLAGLALDAQETLSLTLSKDSEDAFTVALSAKNMPITDIAPTTVRFPSAEQKASPTLFLSEERLDTAVRYESGCAVFSIERLGSYRLAEDRTVTDSQSTTGPSPTESAPPAVPQKTSPVDFLPVAGAAALCLVGAFLRFRRTRR